MCSSSEDAHNHLFLHCAITWDMWQRLFAIDGKISLVPSRMADLLTSFVGFGKRRIARSYGDALFS